jgi:adenylosuccinate synthase
MDEFETVEICIAYRHKKTGQLIEAPPAVIEDYVDLEPVYESHPGWMKNTMNVQNWNDLPEQARSYILRLEEVLGVPIQYLSTGPERSAIILR